MQLIEYSSCGDNRAALVSNLISKALFLLTYIYFLEFSTGTCIDLVNNYTCQCHVGFTGRNCDIVIRNCSNDSCYPNVTCYKQRETISCGPCPYGLTGDGKNCKGILKFELNDILSMMFSMRLKRV